jgi:hypothetical protein
MDSIAARTIDLDGRYLVHHAGQECGEERWRLQVSADRIVVTGEQELTAPHPMPSRQAYRAVLTPEWRLTGLEIMWTVGQQQLRAIHGADGLRWNVKIEYGGELKEQQGDYPLVCEVECATHLSTMFILAKKDFQLDGEHEFPVLRIGPPWMAVSPERMLLRCVETGMFVGPNGPVPAKRYILSLPPQGEGEGYTFWANDDGVVLESYEGPAPERRWMQLVELGHP